MSDPIFYFFFFNDTATTEIYTLSLHDALPILKQPLIDFYRGYQVREGANEPRVTVPLNDNVDYEGGVVTWIDNLAGDRPYGNDLDPTLNLDILEVSFRNLKRWKIIETPQRLDTVQRIIGFQKRLAQNGAF